MGKIFSGLLTIIFLLFSCKSSKKERIFSIYNGSSKMIDSINVSSIVAEITLANIKPNESKSKNYTIVQESNQEGAFRAFIYFNDTTIVISSFGYFSNDKDIAPHLSLEIDKNLSVKEN